MVTRKTILINGDARETSGIADPYDIRPGMLVEMDSDGHFLPHDEAGGATAPLFAREQHENQGAGIDDLIPADDEVTVLVAHVGAVINAVTDDTIAVGEYVESAGDGTVRLFGSGYRLGYAVKASDLSGTVGRVEIVVAPIGA